MDWVTAAAREAMSAVSVLGVANVALSERMAAGGLWLWSFDLSEYGVGILGRRSVLGGSVQGPPARQLPAKFSKFFHHRSLGSFVGLDKKPASPLGHWQCMIQSTFISDFFYCSDPWRNEKENFGWDFFLPVGLLLPRICRAAEFENVGGDFKHMHGLSE
jgi:hypothetical protein